MKTKLLLLAIIIFATSAFSFAQPRPDELDYKLLATTKTSTMQKELDQMSAQGYRVLVGAPSSDSEMVVFLSNEGSAAKPYKYKLLATTRTSTMEKELNEAADAGFRLISSTIVAKDQIFGGKEIVLIMEKDPNSESTYQYKLLATTRTSTLQKEVRQAKDAGYLVVGMVSRDEHMVVMEREIKY